MGAIFTSVSVKIDSIFLTKLKKIIMIEIYKRLDIFTVRLFAVWFKFHKISTFFYLFIDSLK